MKKTETHLTPKGEIIFAALKNPVNKYKSEDKHYPIKLEFPNSEKGFKNAIKKINKRKIIEEEEQEEKDVFHVKFATNKQPKVYRDGKLLESEDIPSLTPGGHAVVAYKVLEYDNTSVIVLSDVYLGEDVKEYEVEEESEDERVARIAAAMKNLK